MYKDKLIIFMHIPKTAGTSLRQIILSHYNSYEVFFHYRNHFLFSKGKINDKIKIVIGHDHFGTHHKEIANRPHNYVTMLRDPVERVISNFYFSKYHTKTIPANYRLEEYLQEKRFSNLQTRYAMGNNKTDLTQAMFNLETFAFVGITEMFNESLFLMKKTLGWKNIEFKRLNVNPKKQKSDTIPTEIIEKIKKANQLDIQLYEWALKKFNKRLNSLDKMSKTEIANWKKSNKS